MGAIMSCNKNNSDVIDVGTTLCTGDEEIDAIVCSEDELPEQGMISFPLGTGEVLLVRHNGHLSAVGSKCSHYGAPLAKGVLGADGTIRCPWHGACFNSLTGDIEDFPGLDSLPCYSVSLEDKPAPAADEAETGSSGGRQVRVRARLSQLTANKRIKEMAKRDLANNHTIAVVGGGAAGSSCVEGLRQDGYTGRVVLVCGEPHLPYDRPKLSKNMAATALSVALRPKGFYESCDIEVLLGNPVLSLNSDAKKLLLTDGNSLQYDQLFVATGGSPRTLSCPGSDLEGVSVLRSPDDAAAILSTAHGQHVVVVGSSFIGMEVAAHLATLTICSSISVVGSGKVPYGRSLGEAVGGRLQEFLQEKGVAFYMGDAVKEIQGDKRVQQVVLSSGTTLAAGLVLCGVGVLPATQFLEGSGVALDDRGHVIVDKYLESSVPGVYSGGDIAAFPLHYGGTLHQESVSIGHWQVAQQHGRSAATNLLAKEGERKTVSSVPVFWTVLLGKSLRYAGYGGAYDDVLISGDLAALAFIAHYVRGDEVVAVASLGRDPAVARFAEKARVGEIVTRQQVEEDGDLLLKS